MTDEEYIAARRTQAQELSELFIKYQKEPIKQNKIVVSTFEGDGGYCCNPRYVIDELLKRKRKYEIVWLAHDPGRHEFPREIEVVEDRVENIALHLSTAKIWIDNYRKPWGTIKREGQFYLQTWHATMGFKAVGLYRGDKFPEIAKLVSEADSKLIDAMVINSEYCRQVYPKKLLYKGEMLKAGSPRVDCLINDREELYSKQRRKYGIPKDGRILLFAPTFRGGNQKGRKQVVSELPSIDFEKVIDALETKTSKTWHIFLRLHPQLSARMEKMPINGVYEKTIDVSQEEDMSQVLGASDLLITDYSSCAFDALYAGIPVFLYADDVKEYIQSRGRFMWKQTELPFQIAQTNGELEKVIQGYEKERYLESARAFKEKHGVIEDGHASERVADVIEKWIDCYGTIQTVAK